MSDLSQGPAGAMTPEKFQPDSEQLARLEAMGRSLDRYWKEAVDGRKASGIETIWTEDEEHYEGIDDLTRFNDAKQTKPPGQIYPTGDAQQSTEFVNITRPYVDAAAAKIGDILLPTDERAWSIGPTPVPELEQTVKGTLPSEVSDGMDNAQLPPEVKQKVLVAEMAAAQKILTEAKDKADRAQKRIEDWQVEGQFHAQMREVLDDAVRIGTGVIKGPIPVMKRAQKFLNNALVIKEEIKPISKKVDARNCFPDPGCGTSIHNGRYFWERDFITATQLQGMKDNPDYIESQINVCLVEGPAKKSEARKTADGRVLDDKELYEIRYFYGYATREDLEAAGCSCDEKTPVQVPVVFTMVNERVIKAALNHLDTGEFPYDFIPWQRRTNSPWGVGVARQIRTPQRIVTAATRVMLTNAGRAAGPLIVMQQFLKGANGTNDIEPWKIYYAPKDATDDVTKALHLVEIPILQEELMAIIHYGLKLAEDVTGMPLLLQGQVGAAPKTYGGQQLADRNAAGTLRRMARQFDDSFTEPHIRRYYTYLLMWGEEDIEKGEFVIDARGSTALVQREIDKQEATARLQASLNPAFGLDPMKTMAEVLRAENRNPKDYQYSDEDLARMRDQKPPPDPRVLAAQVKAESDAALEKQRQGFEAAEAAKDRQLQLVADQVQERMAAMKLQGAKEISFEELRAMLAEVAIKVRATREIGLAGIEADLHKHHNPAPMAPVIEPPGKAPPGQGFAR